MTLPMLAMFTTPLDMSGTGRLLLMLPLCLAVALVYKTIRTERLEDIAGATLQLWIMVLGGMCGVGLGMWALFELMV